MPRGKSAGKDRGPRRREDPPANGSSWLTTYGDAVTLLLAFFVMLFAMSTTDAAKFEEMARSMRTVFTGSVSMLPQQRAVVGDDTPATVDPRQLTPELGPPTDDSRTPPPDTATDDARPLADELQAVLEEAGLLDAAEVELTTEGVVVRVRTDDVLFDTGSAEVRPLGRAIVAAIAPSLRHLENPIRIAGHTDDVPIRRDGDTNWNLSADRAVAVLALMVDDHQVAPSRLSAVGFGEFQPLVPNDSPGNRSRNRRVEILIETDSGAATAELAADPGARSGP